MNHIKQKLSEIVRTYKTQCQQRFKNSMYNDDMRLTAENSELVTEMTQELKKVYPKRGWGMD